MQKVQTVEPEKLDSESIKFHDKRLGELLPLYKARNFPRSLSDSEQKWWEDFCAQRLFAGGANSRLAKYFARIDELAGAKPTKERSYLLEELRLYGQSLMPAELDV
jgi:exodeoxyribonuclease-1